MALTTVIQSNAVSKVSFDDAIEQSIARASALAGSIVTTRIKENKSAAARGEFIELRVEYSNSSTLKLRVKHPSGARVDPNDSIATRLARAAGTARCIATALLVDQRAVGGKVASRPVYHVSYTLELKVTRPKSTEA